MCRKRKYLRKVDAKRALRRIQSHGCQITRTYRCGLCGGWHLTKQR